MQPAPQSRETALAAEFERLAAALRDGTGVLYGYRVSNPPHGSERGAVAVDGDWFAFEFDHGGD